MKRSILNPKTNLCMKRISPTVESEFLHNRYGLTQEDKMGETEHEKYVREQKEAAATVSMVQITMRVRINPCRVFLASNSRSSRYS